MPSGEENSEDLLCPVNAVKNRDHVTEAETLDCVDNDVAERYSGNFEIDE